MMMSVPLLPSSYITRLTTITNMQADRTGSAQARWRDSIAAIKYVAGHPVTGAGIGNNILALNKVRGDTWIQVHDIYLVYAVELGIPGLILFIVLLWKSIDNATTAKKILLQKAEADHVYYLAEGIGVSLVAFSIAALFYPDAYQFYFYYMAGLAIAARSISVTETDKSRPDSQQNLAAAG
jgi:O-antigen ligase